MPATTTAFERVLDKLEGVKRRGNKATARCPVPSHGDRNPSLSVRRIPQRIRLKCFAGCHDEDILGALGLSVADLFDDPRGTTHVYSDGVRVRRSPEKRIWQENTASANGHRTPLLHLDEIERAKNQDKTIFLVEGEPDVDMLRSLGEVATTARGGGENWHNCDPSPLFGAQVIAIADDDPTGAEWAQQVADSLQGKTRSLDFAKAHGGKDISDHVLLGYTLDQIEPLPPPQPAGDQQATPNGRRINITWADTIPPKPVRWAWTHLDQGRMPLGSLVVAAGREGCGKSQFGIWLTAQISQGTLPGVLYGQPRRVIIVATEDSWAHTIVPRLIAAGANLSMVARADVVTEGDDKVVISLPSDIALLQETVLAHHVAIVILDPMLSVITNKLDSYRAHDMRTALEPLVAVADRTGCLMLGIAHFNKGNGTDAATLLSGSHTFRDLPRAIFGFAATKTERVFSQVKNSLGRSDLPSFTYTIEPVTVPTPEGPAEVSKIRAWWSVTPRRCRSTSRRRRRRRIRHAQRCPRIPALLPDGEPARSTSKQSHRRRNRQRLHRRPDEESEGTDARPKSAQPQSRVRHRLGMANRNTQRRLRCHARARVHIGTFGTFATPPRCHKTPQGAQGAMNRERYARGGTFGQVRQSQVAPSRSKPQPTEKGTNMTKPTSATERGLKPQAPSRSNQCSQCMVS
jgi:hypothetical protein